MPPAMGATQKSQSCESAHPPATMAGPVERAGLAEVFVIGIDTRWMSVRQSPDSYGREAFGCALVGGTAEDQPECTKEFGKCPVEMDMVRPLSLRNW